MKFEPLDSYRWVTSPYPFACVGIRVRELATRLGVTLHSWNEDGLGPASGFGGRLPSGHVILFQELEHAVRHFGALGPAIYVDASDLAAIGAEPLVAELVEVLDLARSDICEVVDETARQQAAEIAASAIAYKQRRMQTDPPLHG